MTRAFLSRLSILCTSFAAACSATLSAFTPSEDGVYAVFDTTEGEFTAKLFYDRVPMTVANFVGLAENTISSYQYQTNQVLETPFYEGVTFHRVIAGFMIQSGSRSGLGDDGPGYEFPDEMRELISHDKAGTLSMANSGTNTNGSQFFVTLVPTTDLDDHHTVFGEIVEGMEIVNEIGLTQTDSSDRPTTNIIINKISIVRMGAEALAFNPTDHQNPIDLPIFPNVDLSDSDSTTVTFNRDPTIDYFRLESTDFENWENSKRLSWSESDPSVITDSIAMPFQNANPVFYRYAPLFFPFARTRDPMELNISIPGDLYGGFLVNMDITSNGTFTNQHGNGVVRYRWYDYGNYEQLNIVFDYEFTDDFEAQIYFADGTPSNGTAKVVITDATYGNATTQAAYNLQPAP